MIAVMDYGAGNVRSVMHALEYIGEKSLLTRNAGEILSADAGHSSGRGRVWRCDGAVRASGAVQAMEEFIASGRPFLGICIGEQLLFESSEGNARREGPFAGCEGRSSAFPPARGVKSRTWAGISSIS